MVWLGSRLPADLVAGDQGQWSKDNRGPTGTDQSSSLVKAVLVYELTRSWLYTSQALVRSTGNQSLLEPEPESGFETTGLWSIVCQVVLEPITSLTTAAGTAVSKLF